MTNYKIKRCGNCGNELERIVYTGVLSEEWQWNGSKWECLGNTSLIHNPENTVICPECGSVAGTGIDFGFEKISR